MKGPRMEILFIALGFLQLLFVGITANDQRHSVISGSGYPSKNARITFPEDRMMKDNREQLLEIVQDMLKDARYKNRQTDGPRMIHRKSYAYEIGFSLGIIRETYQHMLSIHRMVVNKYNQKAAYPTLFYGDYRLIEYFNNYEVVHRDEVKIDKLCELIMSVDIYELESRNNMKRVDDDAAHETRAATKPAGESSPTHILRSAILTTKMDPNYKESLMLREEAKHKSAMRQAYLMRKMGLPPNASTTKKRFQNGWPVEETWDYYNSRY